MALAGKVALVTGSSRGIGFAISKEFAENQSAKVLLCSRNINNAIKASRRIKGETCALKVDVTRASDVKSLAKQVLSTHGRIDRGE